MNLGYIIEKIYNSPIGPLCVKLYEAIQNDKPVIIKRYDTLFKIYKKRVAERAILYNAVEPKITEFVLSHIREGNIVVDVGAWIGYYSLLAAKKVGINGTVIAIEPHPENIKRINEMIKLNNFNNVIVINTAVGDSDGMINFLEGASSAVHRISPSSINGYKVNIKRLDDIFTTLNLSKIDLLIMDIEGYEYNALLGCETSLKQKKIKKMIIEIHKEFLMEYSKTPDDIFSLLNIYGYDIKLLYNRGATFHIYAKI